MRFIIAAKIAIYITLIIATIQLLQSCIYSSFVQSPRISFGVIQIQLFRSCLYSFFLSHRISFGVIQIQLLRSCLYSFFFVSPNFIRGYSNSTPSELLHIDIIYSSQRILKGFNLNNPTSIVGNKGMGTKQL